MEIFRGVRFFGHRVVAYFIPQDNSSNTDRYAITCYAISLYYMLFETRFPYDYRLFCR
jgi:hypothetical protein